MPFRQRNDPDDDARESLERARAALTYWKQQLSDAVDELAGLEGIGGWITALTGKREQYRREAEARIKEAKQRMAKERKALIEAQQSVARLDRKEQAAKKAADDHILDLEVVASSVREGDSPAADALRKLESQIDDQEARKTRLKGVIAAAGSVSGLMGERRRAVTQMHTNVLGPLSRMKGLVESNSKIPDAWKRLHDSCIDAGIDPPNVDPASIFEAYGYSIFDDRAMELLVSTHDNLSSEMGVVRDIQLQAASFLRELSESEAALFAKRQALLERLH